MEITFEYRSLNRLPTALGIERKSCIAGGMFALILFQWGAGFLDSAAFFLAYWALIFGISKWEPRIFRILPDLWNKKPHYSAGKFV